MADEATTVTLRTCNVDGVPSRSGRAAAATSLFSICGCHSVGAVSSWVLTTLRRLLLLRTGNGASLGAAFDISATPVPSSQLILKSTTIVDNAAELAGGIFLLPMAQPSAPTCDGTCAIANNQGRSYGTQCAPWDARHLHCFTSWQLFSADWVPVVAIAQEHAAPEMLTGVRLCPPTPFALPRRRHGP